MGAKSIFHVIGQGHLASRAAGAGTFVLRTILAGIDARAQAVGGGDRAKSKT